MTATLSQHRTLLCIDPRRITATGSGGPHFGEFWWVSVDRIKCKRNGDVFDLRGLDDAFMERRNLAPIIKGSL